MSDYTNELITTSNDVILTPNREKHILSRHPEADKYISKIGDILKNPDRVFLQLDKKDTL